MYFTYFFLFLYMKGDKPARTAHVGDTWAHTGELDMSPSYNNQQSLVDRLVTKTALQSESVDMGKWT
jgi:hypothetical protein